ncbi:hypothetical protein E1A91_A04G138400v1 [Gossypium mustelinum]|uniref:Uncharacterized protein n=1 Tax=Gossypium mustelinum TaxID=34275 RepID=A0A5D2ZN95_GOSMU|nr:hypothetical protein E1A91_A04G138400v1 [Gossypium mustelinum]
MTMMKFIFFILFIYFCFSAIKPKKNDINGGFFFLFSSSHKENSRDTKNPFEISFKVILDCILLGFSFLFRHSLSIA